MTACLAVSKDSSLSLIVEQVKAVFGEGRIFSSEPAATYTYEVMRAVKAMPEHIFGRGEIFKLKWQG